jgi:membrane protein implicated in regulation of membrane protease activity
MAACNVPFYIQVIAFLVCTIISLFLTKPLVKKYVNGKTKSTNFDRIIGQDAIVTEQIHNARETGAIKIDGKTWTARSIDNEFIATGELVTIESIEGVKAMVRPRQLKK